MLKNFMRPALCTILALATASAFTSCNNDDPDPSTENTPGGNTPGGNTPGGSVSDIETPVTSQLNINESRDYMAATAHKAINMVDPAAQQQLADLCNDFATIYGDYDFPGEEDDNDWYYGVRGLMTAARHAANGNFAQFARAVETFTYNYKFSDFSGVYTPGNRCWEKTGNSSDAVIVKFRDSKGAECVATIQRVGSGNTNISWRDEYDDDYYQYIDIYNVEVPSDCTFSLTCGGQTYISGTTAVTFNSSNAKAGVKAKVMNIDVDAQAEATNSQIKEQMTAKVNDVLLASSTATANGSGILSNITNESYNPQITKGTAEANLVNRLIVKADANTHGMNIGDINTYFWYYSSSAKQQAQSMALASITGIKQLGTAKLYFAGGTVEQGYLDYDIDNYENSHTDDYGTTHLYGNYEIVPVFHFNNGNSESFEAIFDNGAFDSVLNSFYSLMSAYQRVWGRLM